MATAVILIALAAVGPVAAIAATPAARRRGVTAGYVGAGLLVGVAGVVFALVVAGATLAPLDLPVLETMVAHRTPGRTALAEGLAFWGGTTFTGGAAVLTAAVLALRGRRARALVWVLAVVLGASAIRALKVAVDRPRPPELTRLAEETTTSLPSGHSLMAALGLGLTGAAIVLLTRPGGTGRRALRALAALVTVLLAVAIGVSRTYLGVHWATDVLAGWLLGTALVLAAATLARDREAARPRAATGDDPSQPRTADGDATTPRPVDRARTTGRPVVPPGGPAAGPESAERRDPA